MREKKEMFKTEIMQILDMFSNVCRDMMSKFYTEYVSERSSKKQDSLIKNVFDEIIKVVEYSNSEVKKVSDRYEYVVPRIIDMYMNDILAECRAYK